MSLAIGSAGAHHLMADYARSMPQFGLLELAQCITLGVPNTHFLRFMKAVLPCDAGFKAAWPQFAALALVGSVLSLSHLCPFARRWGR